jgi:serine/threonine protein kinase
MTLASGSKLGPYEIVGPLGAGGMGEVYRARDKKLGRDVAIKVLPREFAADPARMARFEREAKLLASLNHANIASIYGFEDADGIGWLVMELVDGPTLAERILQGPLPLDEALLIARQIAEALEYAHERGIVHRDIKPANMKLSTDGAVKVLDFGLAKAIEGDPASSDISTSPTISRMATQAGIILGTAAYMSPEQAKGKPVDRRTDLWAFGCVLFEMLIGKTAFGGETVTDVLAAVVMKDPDWSKLPASTPPRIREVLERCLKKDQRQRLQSMGDARITIEEFLSGNTESTSSQLAPTRSPALWLSMLPWALLTLLAGFISWLFFEHKSASSAPGAVTAALVSGPDLSDPSFSPDGNVVAYEKEGKLWIRSLRDLESHPIEGTEGGHGPFWSPDSRSIGFFRESEIRRISLLSGQSSLVCPLPTGGSGNEGTWGAEDRIVFSMIPEGLFEVSAQGGQPELFTKADRAKDEFVLRAPHFLSDGKTLLMIVRRPGPGIRLDTVAVQSGRKRQVVLQIPDSFLFKAVSSEKTGHLLFYEVRPNPGIWAVPFSFSALKVTGQRFLVRQKASSFSVSLEGNLVYLSGVNDGPSELSWVDRSGKILGSFGSLKNEIRQPTVSPEGHRVAVMNVGENWSVWVQDSIRNTATNLTTSLYFAASQAWTSDGKRLVFSCQDTAKSPFGLCTASPDGSAPPKPILVLPMGPNPLYLTLSPDNSTALYSAREAFRSHNIFIWSVSLRAGAKPEPFQVTPAIQLSPQFSPDGHFVAYQSDESGRFEVYVRPFPPGDAKWTISTNGGTAPKWNSSGHELFFVEGEKLMAVPVESRPSFKLGLPVQLFSGGTVHASLQDVISGALYDPAPGGQRFVVIRQSDIGPRSIVFAQDWLAAQEKK